jgi:proline racemase
VIDTVFTGKVLAETSVAGLPAVETEIAGRGFVTGLHQFLVQPDDPTSQGFLVH